MFGMLLVLVLAFSMQGMQMRMTQAGLRFG